MISRRGNSKFPSIFFKNKQTPGMKKTASTEKVSAIQSKEKAIEVLTKFLKSDKIKDGYVQDHLDRLNADEDVQTVLGSFFSGLNKAKTAENYRRKISHIELRARLASGNFVRISGVEDLYQDADTEDLWVVEGNSVKRLFKEEDGIAIF